MTIFNHNCIPTLITDIAIQRFEDHQKSNLDFDYHYYGEFDNPQTIISQLMTVIALHGRNFEVKRWEFCGREELCEQSAEYQQFHTYMLCIQYRNGSSTPKSNACRHMCNLVVDSKDYSDDEIQLVLQGIEAVMESQIEV
ncbi:MAG: hypothetical protein UT34_C0002G0074 [candidate division WS6 bacterium GW2011_GWF2_39_15]|uniref:Uncharacterized protein n=1 Tax=candidate division WS6 bacterium GW2011_GWF2_39_15 TaxID=1619100 RepID=A0A0G0QV89_9BACT|nr:MAG: hypothetical protein UT34_C0002G0074 [candidate division WS6 bacterium GW2011_GWF2_39_15]